MKNPLEIIEDSLIVLGVVISIEQIKTILGIILLCVQIGLILYKGLKIIIKKVKNKEDISEDVEDLIDKINVEIDKSKEDKEHE